MDNQTRIQHLCWRAGFGPNLSQIIQTRSRPAEAVANELIRSSAGFTPLVLKSQLMLPSREEMQSLTDKERKEIQRKSRREILDLNIQWMMKMINDNSVLREKMTLFWHGHFACRSRVPVFCMNQNNILRKYALGSFREMLYAVSKDPAMLQFLNNQQNRKDSPNENFARELMELFTLGKGNYTETDVKEAARAFTGWGFDREGEYRFRKGIHDFGEKTFLGVTGNLSGEEVLEIILGKKQTAEFVTRKIYSYFVNDNINEKNVTLLSEYFYDSDYDIGGLMKMIFTSDWFYDEENIGCKIKSPVELIAGLARNFGITFENSQVLAGVQRSLGQVLFNPPNVGGWPGGKSWIDSSSLIARMKLPAMFIAEVSGMSQQGIQDDDYSSGMIPGLRRLGASINWLPFINEFGKYKGEELVRQLSGYLLQEKLTEVKTGLIMEFEAAGNIENKIPGIALKIASLPEYQLC